MSAVKIQINSLAALERLIGGDSELEMEIRNSIIQEFNKKHLKGLAETYLSSIGRMVYQSCQEIVRKELGEEKYLQVWGNTFILTDKAKSAIQNQVDQAVRNEIIQAACKYVDSDGITANLNKLIEARIDILVNERVKQEVARKFNEIIGKLT